MAETTRAEPTDYQTVIRLTAKGAKTTHTVAGTLFGGSKPRLVEVEGIAMEAELGPEVLFIRNRDKPGFVGNLGRTLGANEVNIATFHLGRSAPGEDAVVLVQVDQRLNDVVLAEVCAIPHVLQTKALHF